VKDDNGQLFLAVKDTEHGLLAGTSIEAAFITALMDRSSSKRQVLILDCCHSGALRTAPAQEVPRRWAPRPRSKEPASGASCSRPPIRCKNAWEGDQVIGESDKSVFTHHLLEGAESSDSESGALISISVDASPTFFR